MHLYSQAAPSLDLLHLFTMSRSSKCPSSCLHGEHRVHEAVTSLNSVPFPSVWQLCWNRLFSRRSFLDGNGQQSAWYFQGNLWRKEKISVARKLKHLLGRAGKWDTKESWGVHSLFWGVLGTSPEMRFEWKLALDTDPQVYLSVKTQALHFYYVFSKTWNIKGIFHI